MTFVISVLAAVFIVSAYRIVKLPLSRGTRGLLLVLRLCLFMLLAAAFIEPLLVFERLSSPLRPVPVLVDVSKSMRIFAPDSAPLQVLSRFEQWNAAHTGGNNKFVFYCFGDSLRPISKTADPFWSDRRSFFPATMKEKMLRQAASVVLISDGNWSNATIPAEYFSDKNAFYLPLHDVRHYPYLHMELKEFPEASPLDSPIVAVVALEGFSERNDTITVGVTEKKRTLTQRTLQVSEGFFKQQVLFRLTCPSTGRHLYRFEGRSTADTSLAVSRSALHSALPGRFGYAIYNTRPTLDLRFIRLAMQRRRDFVETPAGKGVRPDLLIFLDWDDNAQRELNCLKPGGAALFIGSLPCSLTTTFPGTAAAGLIRPPSGASADPFEDFDFGKLPAPSRYVLCKELTLRARDVFVSAVLPLTERARADTLDVIFTGRFHRYHFIACAATDLWRWDFWPLGVESEEENVFGFSERLCTLIKEVLINGLSEELLLYPAAPLSEFDSLPFRMISPADLPLPSDIRFACTFTASGNRRYDTSFTITAVSGLPQAIRLKPLPAGRYCMKISAVSNNRRYVFSDSVAIAQDRSEYSVIGQNTALLQEVARPITDLSDSSLSTAFFNGSAELRQPVKETIRFSRNWPLLLMLFSFLAAEWIIRRKIKIE